MSWYYLSFVDGEFLGAAFVEADGPCEAAHRAHAFGINPGGECLAVGFDDEDALPAEEFRYRLLTKADIDNHCGGGVRLGDMSEDEKAASGL